jgi:alpha-1,2-glucosyltransferase
LLSEQGLTLPGDKSAHVATIHLPQMLYFWPYVIFFSLPLVLRPALSPVIQRLPSRPRAFCQRHLTGEYSTASLGPYPATIFILCGLAAVHFNTIVHPYTLADNRHYVFYVFKILLRHPAIRYLAVPFYFVCALLTIRTLESPTASKAQVKQTIQDKQLITSDKQHQPCKVSFIVVWIITTTLSVATAPLVEPRYFIIPWIMWRLHVPYLSGSRSQAPQPKSPYDARLVLETAWLLTINIAIGYSFLYRGFAWPSEPGNVQRFLW